MRTSGTYDVIVIGVGGMGSATVYELASRGLRVLGLERFSIPNDSGSSHGVNRIIRLAYFEDSSYVPLLRRSYERWRELEEASGEKLLYITGSVDTGSEDGRVFAGSLRSCREHNLPHEPLTSADLTRRFPGCRFPDNWMGVYQPDGGFVLSERCIVNHVFAALERGGEVRAHEAVLDWNSSGGHRASRDQPRTVRGRGVGHHRWRLGRAAIAIVEPPAGARAAGPRLVPANTSPPLCPRQLPGRHRRV